MSTATSTRPRLPVSGPDAVEARRVRMAVEPLGALSEVALVLVTVTAILTMGRLFEDGSFVLPLVVVAVIGHALAAAVRRTALSPPAVATVAAVGGALLLTWLRYPDTAAFGVPTLSTLRASQADLSEAWTVFGEQAAPAPVLPGFVLASAVAVWVVAWCSDWAAFRLATVIEATLPAAALFLFGSMLGSEDHRVIASAGFVASVLAFVLLHRGAAQARSSSWVADGAGVGSRAVVASGLAVIAVAVLAGSLVGPNTPGARSAALVDWRGRDGPGARVTVSPLVDIRKRLVDQRDVVVFEVRSDRPYYWRLTSLDAFDGTVWKSTGSFAGVDGELPGSSLLPTETLTQEYRIVALDDLWVPAAYRPTDVTPEQPVQHDEESATLTVTKDADTSDGLQYTVESELPRVRKEDVQRPRPGAIPDEVRDRYLVPPELPESAARVAEQVTAGATAPYGKARLLQDWFRETGGFEYDLDNTNAGHSDEAILDFLESKRGYCEQFSGTFAAMARHLGIPSRVAVGFTTGEQSADDPNRYIVRGKHAHAWPEIYLAGVGWVLIEPTPSRGAPGWEDVTGAEPAQEGPVPVTTATTVAPPTAPSPSTAVTRPFRPEDIQSVGGPTEGDSSEGGGFGFVLRGIAIVAAVAGIWIVGLAAGRLGRRWRRRRGAATASARVRVAWLEGAEAAGWLVPPLRPAETHTEFASRSRTRLGDAGPPIDSLADLASVTEWSPQDPPDPTVDDARALSGEVRRRVRGQMSARQRLRRVLDPRAVLGRRPVRARLTRRNA